MHINTTNYDEEHEEMCQKGSVFIHMLNCPGLFLSTIDISYKM